MSFDKIFDLTASWSVFSFFVIYASIHSNSKRWRCARSNITALSGSKSFLFVNIAIILDLVVIRKHLVRKYRDIIAGPVDQYVAVMFWCYWGGATVVVVRVVSLRLFS